MVCLGRLRMGRQRGGQACAARPCWRRSRRACLSFNNFNKILLKKEHPHPVLILCYNLGSRWGFRAAFGSAPIDKFS